MRRRVLLCPGEDGFIVAEVPSLPGCKSQGRTRDEALANVREAIRLHEEDADVAITVQVRPLSIIPFTYGSELLPFNYRSNRRGGLYAKYFDK